MELVKGKLYKFKRDKTEDPIIFLRFEVINKVWHTRQETMTKMWFLVFQYGSWEQDWWWYINTAIDNLEEF